MAGIDPGRTINGTFGKIFLNGQWLSNFYSCEITDEYDWAELKLSGDRRTKHKLVSVKGTGKISGYKVTSQLQKALVDNPTQSFEIISNLEDPEAYGYERIRISGVKFQKNPIAGWKHGEVVEEEWEFVYDNEPEFVDPILA